MNKISLLFGTSIYDLEVPQMPPPADLAPAACAFDAVVGNIRATSRQCSSAGPRSDIGAIIRRPAAAASHVDATLRQRARVGR
jgi:hypothetical protein